MDEWHRWNGGYMLPWDCTESQMVLVKNRDGSQTGPHKAHNVEWERVYLYLKVRTIQSQQP